MREAKERYKERRKKRDREREMRYVDGGGGGSSVEYKGREV